MWIEKHKPASLEEFHGAKKAVEEIKNWDGKPLIIYGAQGTGKTLLTTLAARHHDFELITITKDNLDEAVKISQTQTLFGGRKLLLVEDPEEHRQVAKIKELIQETKSPLIITTREFSHRKLPPLKRLTTHLQLRRPMASTVANYLNFICEKEEVECDKELLKEIAKNAGGDFRSAINDLEMVAAGKKKILEEDLEILSQRDVKKDIYACLSQVFGGRNINEVVKSTWNLAEQPRDLLFWIDENTPTLYKDKKAIHDSFQHLSRADIFLGRIISRQYWGYLRYVNSLMTAGVNVSRPEKVNYSQYGFPKYWMHMGKTKTKRNMEKSISEKISPILHVSKKIIAQEYIPLFSKLIKGKNWDKENLKEMGLEDDEINFITQ